MKRTYDSAVARIAGNLLTGVLTRMDYILAGGVKIHDISPIVKGAVEVAFQIVEAVEKARPFEE